MPHDPRPAICDYEGSNYRTDFWEGQGRDYEDQVERLALHRLLPFAGGERLLEVGSGYGRLAREYHAYKQVVLLDYSLSQLQYARSQLGQDRRFVFVAADAYHLPFQPGIFDGVSMIRVIHHFRDIPLVFSQIRRTMTPGGVFILEHANKRNLKAMLRHALGQQDWNPYTLDPHEFVELNIDFHPDYMLNALRDAGFVTQMRLPVSFFRLGALKRTVPTPLLVWFDGLLQHTQMFYTPSIFTLNRAVDPGPARQEISTVDALFAAPGTGNPLRRDGDVLIDDQTGQRWAIRDGVYDFKAPL